MRTRRLRLIFWAVRALNNNKPLPHVFCSPKKSISANHRTSRRSVQPEPLFLRASQTGATNPVDSTTLHETSVSSPLPFYTQCYRTRNFTLTLVLIVLPHRLGNLQDTSLDSIGSGRRRSPPLLGTRHPETRGRRRRRRKKIVSTQCRHQT